MQYLFIWILHYYYAIFFQQCWHRCWPLLVGIPCLMGSQLEETLNPWLLALAAPLVVLVPGLWQVQPWWATWCGTLEGPPSGVISNVLGQVHDCWWPWCPIVCMVLVVGIHVGCSVSGHLALCIWCANWISHSWSEGGMSLWLQV